MSTVARSAAAVLLPRGPGVYRFKDASNRTLYLGRAVSLRRRVGSYWGDLGDRQHLMPMVMRIERVEAVSCDSEHEAAWLERNLLEQQIPRWNRTAGGQEVEVCIRLDCSPSSPGLSVVHTGSCVTRQHAASGGSGRVRYFGPYLGAARVRLAVAGLLRIFPLGYAADAPTGTLRELARQHGVEGADRELMAASVGAVLGRVPEAITGLRAQLTSRRDVATLAQAYELAGRIQAELGALDWVTCPQRAAELHQEDAEVTGWADGVLVTFSIKAGRIVRWRQDRRTRARAECALARTPPDWRNFADRNATLAARLAR